MVLQLTPDGKKERSMKLWCLLLPLFRMAEVGSTLAENVDATVAASMMTKRTVV